MKVAYITAGAGGMYCGSCLHDNTLAAAMIRKGHEVTLIPTYTPIRTDEQDVSIDQVFYGAVNVFLEQKSSLFRHTPGIVDRLLNSPALLNWVTSRGASSTDAKLLGSLTLSVLQGEQGKQNKELERLVTWLGEEVQPEIVHLTNSMFLGMARTIKERLGVPVLCAVQGEDIFLEDLVEPYLSEVRRELRERAIGVDGFVATSRYYVEFMVDYLGIPQEKMHQIPLGLKLEGHVDHEPKAPGGPFTIAYLARVCPEKGLHLLVDAFRDVVSRTPRGEVRLAIAGWLGKKDEPYFEQLTARIEEWGLSDLVDRVGEVDRPGKIEFLGRADVLSVPTTYREPKGLFVLEALANGVPVVQPRHGAFPELLEATGGGVLVEPGSTAELADALIALKDDPARCAELGRRGREVVLSRFTDEQMAEQTLELYRGMTRDNM